MNSKIQFDHIFLFAPPWGPVKHRPHHLMKAILKRYGGKVLYIEDTGKRASWAWLNFFTLLRRIEPNLLALRRFKIIPYESKSSIAKTLNKRIFVLTVKVISRIFRLENIVLWNWPVLSYEYIGLLGEKISIYESACEVPMHSWASQQIKTADKILLNKSDLVLVATDQLRMIAIKENSNSFVVPQGVDSELFDISSKTVEKPFELASLTGPILGFIGNIHEWLDCSLLRQVALLRPKWQIVFIGPVRDIGDTKKEIDKIRGLPNIHILGARPYEMLPTYLSWFDVCIIPYKITEITQVSETLKFYEYLGSGKPIIATPLPPLKRWSDVVSISSTPEEFVEMVEKALHEPPQKSTLRRNLARDNSWEKRSDYIMQLLQDTWVSKYES